MVIIGSSIRVMHTYAQPFGRIMKSKTKNKLETIKHIQRGLSIFKRGRSPYWQLRIYDNKTKRYVWKSTKETSRIDAAEVALEYLKKFNLGELATPQTPKSRSFEHYAKMLYDQALISGNTTTIKDRRKILHRPEDGLLAYFGKMDVADINTGHFREYLIHLDKRRSKPLANSTKQKQCLMARQVLNLALEDGLISTIPSVPKLNLKSKPRPSFTNKEYKDFMKTMKVLAQTPHHSKAMGVTLEHKNMFQFMVHTFLRPTTSELYALKHKHIELQHDPQHLQVYVKGKTGARVSASMPLAVLFYQAQLEFHPNATGNDFVFFPNHPDRLALLNSVGRVFNKVAEHCDLKTDKWDQRRTPYSFRHYALQNRLRGSKGLVNIHMLAKNAGTSVQILQDFYLKNLEISGDLLENLQIHSVDEYAAKKFREHQEVGK